MLRWRTERGRLALANTGGLPFALDDCHWPNSLQSVICEEQWHLRDSIERGEVRLRNRRLADILECRARARETARPCRDALSSGNASSNVPSTSHDSLEGATSPGHLHAAFDRTFPAPIIASTFLSRSQGSYLIFINTTRCLLSRTSRPAFCTLTPILDSPSSLSQHHINKRWRAVFSCLSLRSERKTTSTNHWRCPSPHECAEDPDPAVAQNATSSKLSKWLEQLELEV